MDSYVGKRLDGRYEIREIIGVGGMAVVYKAYDNIDDRIVAVKILKEEFLANEEFRRRFKNESKAIAVLSHPNIVKVYDVSFGDRLQYIVMEYVEGITLKEYIEQQKIINWKEAVHFTTQILRALQHAHDKGIVHRDVKPQNIMLLQNGNIKVTDFGIARFSRGETRTMTESAIGSVHYISPEQARGEITDDKADIYSVGVVLYEMITGKLPFESDSAVSVAIMQLQNEAVPPRELNDEIPVGLEQITLKAMQKDPKKRYQSAAEMLLDLDELKRNPAVKFNYNYFVDKEPTKFVGAVPPVAAPAQTVSTEGTAYDNYGSDDDEMTEDDGKKKIPIIVGVISAVLIVVLLIILFLYFFTDIFNSSKVSVPNFVGMSYSDKIKDNKEYTNEFKFDVTYVSSSAYSAGQVVKQTPASGSKVKKGSTIKLEVVKGGTEVQVPKVIGLTLAAAKSKLAAAGFSNIKTSTQYSADVDPGLIVDVNPDEGETVDVDDTVTLYVATDEDSNQVEVPNVVGLSSSSVAKEYLESVGLKLGDVTKKDSDKPAGQVLSQSVDNPNKVTKGTKIDLVVSSGTPQQVTYSASIYTPNANNSSGTMTIYLNNSVYATKTGILFDGSSMSISVTGTGNADSIKVIASYGGSTYTVYTAVVDFTGTAAAASGVTSTRYAYMPDVTGQTPDAAKATLSALGYTNITVTTGLTGSTVKSQTPSASSKLYTVSTAVSLITN
jgi:serine/threonine protein kinase